MSKALAIPDARTAPVPAGWAEAQVLPVVAGAAWSDLDAYEAQLHGVASYIESLGGNAVEFEKALRMVEWRRGVLLGPRDVGRPDNGTSVSDLDVPPKTAQRYRTIARSWDDLIWPHLLKATNRAEVTQAHVLRLARLNRPREEGEAETCEVEDLVKLADSGYRAGTIYADPPWRYGNQATRGATGDHYKAGDPGMDVEAICALPIASLRASEAHLHLWTTNAFLFDARLVMEAWGFAYKSCFVWVKPQMGMGNYWRVSHEFCLLGVHGSVPFREHDEMSWREWRRGQHSAKPERMYELIERVSPSPYLELFARRQREGWRSWGNEIGRDLFTREAS